MIKLTSIEQFNELKQQHTVFLFSAKWCPDCRVIEPFIDEFENMYPHMTFVYIDRDEFLELCTDHNILGIPSFVVYKNNQVLNTFISKLRKSKQEIINFLDTVK